MQCPRSSRNTRPKNHRKEESTGWTSNAWMFCASRQGTKKARGQAISRKPHHKQPWPASTPTPQQSVDCQFATPSAHTEVSCRMRIANMPTAGASTSTHNRSAG